MQAFLVLPLVTIIAWGHAVRTMHYNYMYKERVVVKLAYRQLISWKE